MLAEDPRVPGSLDSWSSLILAEHLHLPLFTASEEATSTEIDIR